MPSQVGQAASCTSVLRLGKGLLTAFLASSASTRIIEHPALLFGQRRRVPHAVGDTSRAAVVGEQARVQLGITVLHTGAGAFGRERLHTPDVLRWSCPPPWLRADRPGARHLHHALAVRERLRQRRAQQRLVGGRDVQAHHGQLDGVFLETVQAQGNRWWAETRRPHAGGYGCAGAPVGQRTRWRRPCALTTRAPANDVLSPEVFQQLRGNAVGRLRLHRRTIARAVLHPS